MDKKKALISAAVAGLIVVGSVAKVMPAFAEEAADAPKAEKEGCKGKKEKEACKGKSGHHKAKKMKGAKHEEGEAKHEGGEKAAE